MHNCVHQVCFNLIIKYCAASIRLAKLDVVRRSFTKDHKLTTQMTWMRIFSRCCGAQQTIKSARQAHRIQKLTLHRMRLMAHKS